MSAAFKTAKPLRTSEQRQTLEEIDAGITTIASSFAAATHAFPALISREVLDHAGYPEAFPHLLLEAAHGAGPTGWCLSPAVCYHVYSFLAARTCSLPLAVTARGTCFRNEEGICPGVRQIEFEMREIVFLGSREWVVDRAETTRARIGSLAVEFGLRGQWKPADDPFFLPAARGKALLQRLKRLKLEYRSAQDGLALASVNRHEAFFGERFGIRDADGAPVHSACVAVGLDRWCARAVPPVSPAQGRSGHASTLSLS